MERPNSQREESNRRKPEKGICRTGHRGTLKFPASLALFGADMA
jgi:hypothetical protein